MNQNPIIKALQEEFENDIERLVESHTKWFIESTGYSVTNARVQDEIYDYENTIRKGHEAASARLLALLEKAVDNLEAILKHVSASTDIQAINAVYNTPSHSLKLAADELEKKDAAIKKAREFLTTLANASGEIEKDGK
jgi:hypothetical protein